MQQPFSHVLRKRLIEVARSERTTSYAQVAPLVGIDLGTDWGWVQIGRELGAICWYEDKQDRPMLSAVVGGQDGGLPGNGFFVLAKTLGKYNGKSNDEKYLFWAEELKQVFAYWKAHPSDDIV